VYESRLFTDQGLLSQGASQRLFLHYTMIERESDHPLRLSHRVSASRDAVTFKSGTFMCRSDASNIGWTPSAHANILDDRARGN